MSASPSLSGTSKRLWDDSGHEQMARRPRSPLRDSPNFSRSVSAVFMPNDIDSDCVVQNRSTPTGHGHCESPQHDEDATRKRNSLTKKQQRFLRLWHEDFAQADSSSAMVEECTTALATAMQTQPGLVFDYIERRRKGSEEHDKELGNLHEEHSPSYQSQASEASTEPYTLSKANDHLPQPTLALVEKYISACRRRRSPTDGRRSVNSGPFRCTFGCGYRTKRVFDWRRHEETHEPQELWLCTICARSELHNPFLVNRKDKFLKHAADKHTHVAAEEVLQKSKLPFVPRAELGCTYCGEESGTWDERCRHVLGHFEDEMERGMKRVKVVHEEGEEEPALLVSEDGSVGPSVASSREEEEAAG